ncbi:MAG: hypothetical protein ACREBS_03160 [Nitrososphaerales archaeon]
MARNLWKKSASLLASLAQLPFLITSASVAGVIFGEKNQTWGAKIDPEDAMLASIAKNKQTIQPYHNSQY